MNESSLGRFLDRIALLLHHSACYQPITIGYYRRPELPALLQSIMSNQQLEVAYTQVLASPEAAYLQSPALQAGNPKGLSGLFLPTVHDGYAAAKHKVMLVGSETAGWDPIKRSAEIRDQLGHLPWPDAYVKRAMHAHQKFFATCLGQKNRDRGHTFMNYARDIAAVAGAEGLIYANLFCFDWRRGSPLRAPEFPQVKALSKKLLDAQIDVLKPDYIIFANGISSAKQRREFFPVGAEGRCSKPANYLHLAPQHHLWEFTLDERIRCFRVHHPAARSKDARDGRQGAITLLAAALNGQALQSGDVSAVPAGV